MAEFYAAWEAQFLLWTQQRLRTKKRTAWMRRITRLGNGGMVWILAAVLLFLCDRRELALSILVAQLLGVLITNLFLKHSVKRCRPFETIPHLKPLLPPPRDWSFPSGHTTSSISAGLLLLLHLPLWIGIPCMCLALLIVWSRLYLGVHYPTDILGGILIGIFCAGTADWLNWLN
jgi:undecaprenyl-diphosphatase